MIVFIVQTMESVATNMLTELKTYSALMNTIIYNIDKGIIILNKDLKIIEINDFIEKIIYK